VIPAIMVVQLTAVMAGVVVATAGPAIVRDLHGLRLYPWVFSAYALTTAASGPVVGKLSDFAGRRPFYIAGMVLFVAGALLGALAPNMTVLVASRAMAGAGGGAMAALTGLTVGDLFPPRQRARWLAVTFGVYGGGSLVGPWLGGAVTDHFGWRWLFAASAVPPLVATLVLAPVLPKAGRIRSLRVDLPGVGLFVVAVAALLYAVTEAEQPGASPLTTAAAAAVALAGIVALLWRESSAPAPFISLPMFRNRTFTVSVGVSFLMGVVMYALIVYVPLYFQAVRGGSATGSGLLLMPMMAPFIVGGIGAGQLIARSGRYLALVRAATVVAAAGTVLLWLPGTTPGAWFAAGLAVAGLGLGALFPVLSLVVQSCFPYSSMGAAHSLRQLFTSLSNAVGVPLMGIFLFAGSNLTVAGVQRLLLASTVIALGAALLALLLPAIALRSSFDEKA
jgi:MFS family permease